ncbi:MAG: DNA polymerase III subunit beta [Clostridia bacterium]|nr:DNA polymerase III subunit beta [Clostridia bacterium]
MEISCTKSKMIEILNIVQRAIGTKNTLPIMECIKIDADARGRAIFTGNDGDICIEYNAEDLNIKEGGSIALASRMFGDIVRKLPDGNISINVNEENSVTKIKSGISEFNIQGLISDEYPTPPVIEEKYSFLLDETKLKDIIKKIISFVAVTEGKRPTLTGALFDIKGDELTVVASDGHRLGVVKEKIDRNLGDAKFIIPGSTLRELLKILNDSEKQVKIIVSERHVLFNFENYEVYTRVIEGDFLKYEPILAANNTIVAKVNSREFKEALERAILIINDDESTPDKRVPVKLNVGFDKIQISCMTPKGKVSDTVGAELNGGELTIGFNCRFLIEAISACDEEDIMIEFSTPTSGCFMRSLDENKSNYVFMILPVRLYN